MRKPGSDWNFVLQVVALLVALAATLVILQLSFVLLDGLRASTDPIKAGEALQAIANLVGSFGGALLAGGLAIAAGVMVYRSERRERDERKLDDQHQAHMEELETAQALGKWLVHQLSGLRVTLNIVRNSAIKKLASDDVATTASAAEKNHTAVQLPAELRQRLGQHFSTTLAPLDELTMRIDQVGRQIVVGVYTVQNLEHGTRQHLKPTPDWAAATAYAVQCVILPLRDVAEFCTPIRKIVADFEPQIRAATSEIIEWAKANGLKENDFGHAFAEKESSATPS